MITANAGAPRGALDALGGWEKKSVEGREAIVWGLISRPVFLGVNVDLLCVEFFADSEEKFASENVHKSQN